LDECPVMAPDRAIAAGEATQDLGDWHGNHQFFNHL
jgi:hypothetical protein